MNSIAEALRRGKMDPKSTAIFAMHFSHAVIEIAESFDMVLPKRIVVQSVWKGVDRPNTGGWSCGMDLELAERLKRAIESGALFCMLEVKTDTNNQTYISATSLIIGRTLTGDLKKIGY